MTAGRVSRTAVVRVVRTGTAVAPKSRPGRVASPAMANTAASLSMLATSASHRGTSSADSSSYRSPTETPKRRAASMRNRRSTHGECSAVVRLSENNSRSAGPSISGRCVGNEYVMAAADPIAEDPPRERPVAELAERQHELLGERAVPAAEELGRSYADCRGSQATTRTASGFESSSAGPSGAAA